MTGSNSKSLRPIRRGLTVSAVRTSMPSLKIALACCGSGVIDTWNAWTRPQKNLLTIVSNLPLMKVAQLPSRALVRIAREFYGCQLQMAYMDWIRAQAGSLNTIYTTHRIR